MNAVFKSPHAAASFNLLPPGSAETAMYVGQFGQHCMNRFDGLLPADGEMQQGHTTQLTQLTGSGS